MKLLCIDIETFPAVAYVWGLWKENIGIDQIKKPSEMVCFCAKWYGSKDVIFKSVFHDGKKKMLSTLHKLLDEADALIHFNGRCFDSKTILKEFIVNKMLPPSPYKQIDLIETSRRIFNFQSNKLDFLCQTLGLGKKQEHEGFGLWRKCMNNDKAAWSRMKTYNIKDVLLTEKLYERLLPWIPNHPRFTEDKLACPNCNSTRTNHRGSAMKASRRWERLQCQNCGHWFYGNLVKVKGKNIK